MENFSKTTLKFFGIILVFTFLSACKKDTKIVTENQINSSDTSKVYGVFTLRKVLSDLDTISFTQGGVSSAVVSEYPLVKGIGVSGGTMDIGNVKLNNIEFKKQVNLNISYIDTVNNLYFPPYNWTCSGGTSFNAFSYTYQASFPNFSGYNQMPDSIEITNGINLLLAGVANSDSIEVYFATQKAPIKTTNLKTIPGNAPYIKFSYQELHYLNEKDSIKLYIGFIKNNFVRINGKKLNFRNYLEHVKLDVCFK